MLRLKFLYMEPQVHTWSLYSIKPHEHDAKSWWMFTILPLKYDFAICRSVRNVRVSKGEILKNSPASAVDMFMIDHIPDMIETVTVL